MSVNNRPEQSQGLEKSRLGRLLVNRGYITERQLTVALEQQRATGERLGEVLIAQKLISEKMLTRTLRHQKRYRYAAAFAAIAVAPLQPLVAFAATAPAVGPVASVSHAQQRPAGLQPLTETEMRGIEGQGTDELFEQIAAVTAMAEGERKPDAVEALKLVVRGLVPIINMLDAETTIRGVHYREGEHAVRVLPEGKIQMMLPAQIERVSMLNIRPQGSVGPSMGNLYISDIRFSEGSFIKIYPH